MEKDFKKRKHPRLKNFDYSSSGAYFITICTQNRKCLFSRIVGRGLAPAEVEYSSFGEIAKEELFLLEERFPCVIDSFVIMPNHIHIILILNNETAGASPRPTVMNIICAYKSLTTKKCKNFGLNEKLFQTSFYEHVIRKNQDLIETQNYIYENPARWQEDQLYSEKSFFK